MRNGFLREEKKYEREEEKEVFVIVMQTQRGKSFLREKERQGLLCDCRSSAFIESQRKFREKSRK